MEYHFSENAFKLFYKNNGGKNETFSRNGP